MYEDIKATRIMEVSRLQIDSWVEHEVINLVNDFGQNMPDEMLKHTCTRLRDVLVTKYRRWYVGDVHAAFQTGLSGGYGAFHKVTIRSLFHFLKSAQSQLTHNLVIQKEIDSATKTTDVRTNDPRYNTAVCQLMSWATKNNINLDFIDPAWTDEKMEQTKSVSPKIKELGAEFLEAKEMDLLHSLRTRLRNVMAKATV